MVPNHSSLERFLKADMPLFFMHIPKTAGTTLIQIIEQQFDEEEIARWLYPFRLVDAPPDFFKQHRYFHGHVDYDLIHSLLPHKPASMTVLREPVERYLSHFGNHKRVSFHQIPDITKDAFARLQQISLDEFVKNPPSVLTPFAEYFQNLQAKLLASELPTANIKERNHLIRTLKYLLPAPEMGVAKKRLDEFAFVGLTERFQDSLFLMAYTFGWYPATVYKNFNTAQPRPQKEKLDTGLLQEIRALNELDQLVYEDGCKLFQTRYDQMQQELLAKYGRREHAHLKLPLEPGTMVDLLDQHYQVRFQERNTLVPAIKLNFNKKMPGANWHLPEQQPVHGSARWSGPGNCAHLDFPLAATTSAWLRFSVVMAITADVLASLVVKVNGEPVHLDFYTTQQGAKIYLAYLHQHVLARRPGCVRVSFELKETLKPIDVFPGNKDERLLGIYLNNLEIEAALPVEEELVNLKKLTQIQEQRLGELTTRRK